MKLADSFLIHGYIWMDAYCPGSARGEKRKDTMTGAKNHTHMKELDINLKSAERISLEQSDHLKHLPLFIFDASCHS